MAKAKESLNQTISAAIKGGFDLESFKKRLKALEEKVAKDLGLKLETPKDSSSIMQANLNFKKPFYANHNPKEYGAWKALAKRAGIETNIKG